MIQSTGEPPGQMRADSESLDSVGVDGAARVDGNRDEGGSLVERYEGVGTSAARMMAWIADIVDFGVRRPGSEAGHRVEEWCEARFRELGLESVRREPFDVPVWEPGDAHLIVWPDDRPGQVVTFEGFPLPHTLPTAGLEAELALLDPLAHQNQAVEGAIAVDVIELGELPPAFMSQLATGRVDPSGELDEYVHLLPFSFRLGREADVAVHAGASGYVGVLAGMPWSTRDYYLPYDAVERPLSGLWIDRSDGARLVEMMADGPLRGRIEVDARRRPGLSSNVIGVLPGASDQWVIIGSHHDAPWASAVEDASGVALVLGQAEFWAQVPIEERPHNLLFLLNGGHMAGAAGMASFAEQYQEVLDQVVLSVHLEHTAAASKVEDGRLVATDEPEVRWWFTTRSAALEGAVVTALRAEEVDRSWVLPPEAFGEFPPTDGGGFHLHGVPVVDFLAAPVYLVDSCDTLDKVHEPSLEPVTRAVIRIVESLMGRTADDVRAVPSRRV